MSGRSSLTHDSSTGDPLSTKISGKTERRIRTYRRKKHRNLEGLEGESTNEKWTIFLGYQGKFIMVVRKNTVCIVGKLSSSPGVFYSTKKYVPEIMLAMCSVAGNNVMINVFGDFDQFSAKN
jgi:hypothetical protein